MSNLSPSWWRTLPPAGAPLPVKSLVQGLLSLKKEEIEKDVQAQIMRYFGVEHCILTDSGRSGLALTLKALQKCLPPSEKNTRTEVLIPAYVSYSVPSAVAHAGFEVQLYDVDPHTLAPDYASMQTAASDKTLAIVLCHQFGLPFAGAPAKEVANHVGAFLVDDAAQAMGSTVHHENAGCMGHVGLFSLSRGKPLTSVEGGIVLTDISQIASALYATIEEVYTKEKPSSPWSDMPNIIKSLALFTLRRPLWYTLPASLPWLNIGASIFEPHFPDGALSTYRMGLTAAALPLLKSANAQRRQWASRYSRLLETQKELRSIPTAEQTRPIYLRYPVLPELGSEGYIQKLLQHNSGLTAKKLGISRGFPQPLYAVPELKPHLASLDMDADRRFAGARYLADNLITLPTHDQVRGRDFDTIAHFFAETSLQHNTIQG